MITILLQLFIIKAYFQFRISSIIFIFTNILQFKNILYSSTLKQDQLLLNFLTKVNFNSGTQLNFIAIKKNLNEKFEKPYRTSLIRQTSNIQDKLEFNNFENSLDFIQNITSTPKFEFKGPEANFFNLVNEEQRNFKFNDSKNFLEPPFFEEDISTESRVIPRNFNAPRPLKNSQAISILSNSGWSKRNIDTWDSSRNKLYSFSTPTELKRNVYWDYLLKLVQDDTPFIPIQNSEQSLASNTSMKLQNKSLNFSSPFLFKENKQRYYEWKNLNLVGAKSCREIPTPQRKLEAWRQQDNLNTFYRTRFSNQIANISIDPRLLEQYYLDEFESIIVIRDGIVDKILSKNINFEQIEGNNLFCGSSSSLIEPDDRYKINQEHYWIPEYSNQNKVNTQPFHRAQIGGISRKYDNDFSIYDYRKFDFGMAKFTALNQAGLKDSATIIINANTTIDKPIQIIELNTYTPQMNNSIDKQISLLINPRVIIWLKENSNATIQQTFISLSQNHSSTINSVTRILLDPYAKLNHHYIQEINEHSSHWENIAVANSKNSEYNFRSVQFGALSSRINMQIEGGDSSTQRTLSLGLPHRNQRMAMYQMFHHEYPNMITQQKYKYLLAGKGHGFWRGRVRIEKDGIGARAATLCRAILLNQGVECITVPTLEIIPKDVQQASHGAAISDLEEEPIFFLKTRGINEYLARLMLLKAFAEEVTDDLVDSKLKLRIISRLKSMIPIESDKDS